MRSHPIPFRTRKLSSYGPMVLGPQGPGRVGRCQILYISKCIEICTCFFVCNKKCAVHISKRSNFTFWLATLYLPPSSTHRFTIISVHFSRQILRFSSKIESFELPRIRFAILKHFSSSQTIRSLTTTTKLKKSSRATNGNREFYISVASF